MEDRKVLSTFGKVCVDLCKDYPVATLGIAATVVAVYVYKSLWEEPTEQTIKIGTVNKAKIRQNNTKKSGKQTITVAEGDDADIEQNTTDGKGNTQGFPPGQSNH